MDSTTSPYPGPPLRRPRTNPALGPTALAPEPVQRTALSSEPSGRTGRSSDSTAPAPPTAPALPAPRDLRRLWRVALAVLLPLGPVAVAVAFALRPFRMSDEPTVIVERILASPYTDLLLWLGYLAPGLLLLAVVVAGHLARRGAPVLATVATTINVLAFGLMAGAVASSDLVTVAAGRAGVDTATILTITSAIGGAPQTAVSLGIWVPGHILGMVLLAVALRRARVLPVWAAVVLGISQPIHFLAFVVLDNQYVDAVAGWGFTAVGFTAVAVALLRTHDDAWDLAPAHPTKAVIAP